jgi:CHAT domain-containing protein
MKFRPLAGTRREITLVRDHFTAAYPDGPVTTLRGSEATEQAFRKSLTRPRFVHLATHGFFLPPEMATRNSGNVDNQNYWSSTPQGLSRIHPGLLSGITFAGANRQPTPDRDDGILTAVEAQQLDLAGTDLVVLSACETALGTSTHGEGLMGLQRAFQIAGARSLASSLWQVDDDATAALMNEFYLNLWERKLPKLDALRQAQLAILRRYDPGRLQQGRVQEVEAKNVRPKPGSPATPPRRAHPYFWAGFTLSGDWH